MKENFPRYFLARVDYLDKTIPLGDGKSARTFSIPIDPPVNTSFSVAFLNGWSLAYKEGEDHHVQQLQVLIKPLSSASKATQVEGSLLLRDKEGDDQWQGRVWITVLHFCPYWS